MLRRALVVTGVALIVGAACAYAVSPRAARMSLSFSRGLFGLERGFSPAPPDSSRYATEGGVPGTFCPTPSRDASPADQKPSSEPSMFDIPAAQSPAISASSHDSLLTATQAKCDVPASTAASKP